MGENDVLDQAPGSVPATTPGEPGSPAGPQRRRWFKVFLIAGLVLGASGVIGLLGPAFGYVILDPVTRHVGAALTLSVASLFVAAILMPLSPGWPRVVRVFVAIGLGFVLVVFAMLTAWFAQFGESRYESPDGRSIVVVSEGSGTFDPVWYLSVQQSSPVFAKTWELGCFSGDSFDSGFASIRWVSPTLVEAKAESGQTFQVTIDPSDSQPSTTIMSGYCE